MNIKTLLDLHFASQDLERMAQAGRAQAAIADRYPNQHMCRLSDEAIVRYEELAYHINMFNSRYKDTIEGAILSIREIKFNPNTTPIEEMVGLS